MPSILSFDFNPTDNPFKKGWRRFRHLELFYQLTIIGLLLFIFATPIITQNSFDTREHAATTVSPTDWPQFQYNAQHIGRTSVQVNPNYSAAWIWMDKTHIVKNFVNGPNKSITDGFSDLANFKSTVIFAGQMQPITLGGKTIFSSMNGSVYAVNSLTGDNVWDMTTGAAILSTAAYDQGNFIITSMDGKVYGLNEADGSVKWTLTTGAGINASPVVMNGTVYIGSRDGSFYAIDSLTGAQKWKYDVRDPSGKFNKAAIVSEAAVSEDGSIVLFGAENMYFYALNTSDGSEKWAPKQLVGQSFLYSWPVVVGNKVIVRTMSSLGGAENLMESVLDGLSATATIAEEKAAIQTWLTQNPHQRSMYVLDIGTGTEPFQVAMGRVSGENFTSFPPVVDNSARVLTYWRSRSATLIQNTACFGTKYCPDISGLDMNTGDRVKLAPTSNSGIAPELDNGYLLTVGGNRLYMGNHFRGTVSIDLASGATTRVSTPIAHWDCGDFRGYPYQIIYYGNDTASTSQCNPNPPDPRPGRVFSPSTGWSGVALAISSGTKMMFVTETNINAVVGIKGQ